MKCGNCPIVENIYTLEYNEEQVPLYECPFGDKAIHLWDHRCTKLLKRKEMSNSLEIIQNGG